MLQTKSLFAAVSTAALALGIAACATIIDGSQQVVKFEVEGTDKAKCVLFNEDYKYHIYAPAEVTLERSRKDLRAECSGNGGRAVNFIIPSYQGGSGAFALNVSNGLIPGTAVDVADGAYFAFPNPVIIDFDVEDGYRASEVTEEQVNHDSYHVRDIWPEDMTVGQSKRVMMLDNPPETEFIMIEEEVEIYHDDEEIEALSATELLHKEYNEDVYIRHEPSSVTVTETEMKVKDSESYKYEEVIGNSKMQPVISAEDMTRGNEPDIFDTMDEFDVIEPAAPAASVTPFIENKNPMVPIIEETDIKRQKIVITEETQQIENVQMSPIIEMPKKPTPPKKVAVKKIEKPEVEAPVKQAVLEKAPAKIDNAWTQDVSYFTMDETYIMLEDNFDASPAPAIAIPVSAINNAETIVEENDLEDLMVHEEKASHDEQDFMPMDALSTIETSTNAPTTIGAATPEGETGDMDDFMNELMRDLEAAMPPSRSANQ